jgi:hypothetical protein
MKRIQRERPWEDYPEGTRLYAAGGEQWVRTAEGWAKYENGTLGQPWTHPANHIAVGDCLQLPEKQYSERKKK